MHAWLYVLAVLAILQGVTQVASTGDQPSSSSTSSSSFSSSSSSASLISISNISPDEQRAAAADRRPSPSDGSVAKSESTMDEDSLERPAAGELHLQLDPVETAEQEEEEDAAGGDSDSDNSLDISDKRSSSSSSSSHGSHSSDSDSISTSKPDPETLVEIEKNLLSLFGFPKRPKIDRSKVVIPEAMKQLYAQIMGHDLVDSVNVPKEGLNTRNANTVRSFTHEGEHIFSVYLLFLF